MYVIDVVPFSRSAPPGALTYRSSVRLEPGTLVRVTLRKKPISALVISCETVAEAKAVLKAATFALSSSAPAKYGQVPAALRAAAEETAGYHAASLGGTLASLFSELVRSDVPLEFPKSFPKGDGHVVKHVEGSLSERLETYHERIQANAAEKRATLLVVPTIAEIEYWKAAFREYKPVVLASGQTPKKRAESVAALADSRGLVISTPSFSWLPIPHLETIILERISAGGYRLPKRPYLDLRVALLSLAKAREITAILGDYPLPLEYRPKPEAPIKTAPPAVMQLIDLRVTPEKELLEEQWKAVSKEITEQLQATLLAGGRSLVLAVRKGYAPSVVCRDCGQALADERGMAYTFTTEGGKRRMRTADGKAIEDAALACPNCGSWNLMPLGVGVERVLEELVHSFPRAKILHIEAEAMRSAAQARKLQVQAMEPGTICVGTEAMLPWLLRPDMEPFDVAAVASADSLLALPFWRARERFVRLGLLLGQCANLVLLASRHPEDTAVEAVIDSVNATFFAEEAGLRKALKYPPYGVLLVLQAEASPARMEALDAAVRQALLPHAARALPDRMVTRTVARRSFVLQLPLSSWPDATLSRQLAQLPPSVRILIDPEAF